ncbi:MAG: type IX secretion system protein PorQ [Flavobacteriales bacterium]|jgi:hypothetical protein
MRVLLLLWCVIGLAFSANAQLGGQTIFNSLNIYGSARVAAMGGNYLAIKDGDINVMAVNPSLLDSNLHQDVALSYVDYYAGSNFGYASYAHGLKNKKITLGGTLQFLSHGTMDETDGLGNVIGEFSASEYVLTGGIGYQYDSLWSMGANVKTVYASFANYYSLGAAVDAAVTFHQPRRLFSASLVLRNVGYQFISFSENERESFPAELQFGIVKQLRHAPFRFSVVAENLQQWNLRFDNPNEPVITDPVTGEVIEDNTWVFGDNLMRHMVFGTEFLLGKNFNLRIGYNYRRRQELKLSDRPATAGLSFGFGLMVRRFRIDYGRAIYHAAGPANHFTVSTNLGSW